MSTDRTLRMPSRPSRVLVARYPSPPSPRLPDHHLLGPLLPVAQHRNRPGTLPRRRTTCVHDRNPTVPPLPHLLPFLLARSRSPHRPRPSHPRADNKNSARSNGGKNNKTREDVSRRSGTSGSAKGMNAPEWVRLPNRRRVPLRLLTSLPLDPQVHLRVHRLFFPFNPRKSRFSTRRNHRNRLVSLLLLLRLRSRRRRGSVR